jgi:exosortase
VEAKPTAEVVRSRTWQVTLGVLLVGVGFAFHAGIAEMVRIWVKFPDYSHGFLVPVFAAYLLWSRRAKVPTTIRWPDPIGLVPLVAGVALSLAGGVTNYAKELCQGFGLILALAGVLVLMCGRLALRWAWPGLAFLLFMVKLPDRIEIQFMFKLRQIASGWSNFLLQTMGFPSYVGGQEGTVITVLREPEPLRLGVEWACSGLSMVLTFVAVATAAALMVKRPVGDKAVILLSAVPIAVVSNVIRITVTALVYIAGWKALGDLIVHDLAGYLMMPLALGFIWLELKLIDWLFVVPPAADRDDVLKTAAKTAAGAWVVKDRPEDAGTTPPGAGR